MLPPSPGSWGVLENPTREVTSLGSLWWSQRAGLGEQGGGQGRGGRQEGFGMRKEDRGAPRARLRVDGEGSGGTVAMCPQAKRASQTASASGGQPRRSSTHVA